MAVDLLPELEQLQGDEPLLAVGHVLLPAGGEFRVLDEQLGDLMDELALIVGHGLEEGDDLPVDDVEGVEVEPVEEGLLEAGDFELLEMLSEDLVPEGGVDVDHSVLNFVELELALLVAEEDEGDDLGLLDESLHHVAVLVDDALGVRPLDPQQVELPEDVDEEGGNGLQLAQVPADVDELARHHHRLLLYVLQHLELLQEVHRLHLLLVLLPLVHHQLVVYQPLPQPLLLRLLAPEQPRLRPLPPLAVGTVELVEVLVEAGHALQEVVRSDALSGVVLERADESFQRELVLEEDRIDPVPHVVDEGEELLLEKGLASGGAQQVEDLLGH